MALFGKNLEDEEYDEDEELEIAKKEKREGKKFNRNFKDLNPANKKKRKEPPKPWGKKERLLVLFVFGGMSLASALMALKVREFKLPGIPRISLKSIKMGSIFKEETITIGKKPANLGQEGASKKAVDYFNLETGKLSGKYGFMVRHLNDEFEYGVNSDEIFQGASLLKLPLMVLIYQESEKGNLDLEKKYSLKDSDKVAGSGFLDEKPQGSTYTYKQLVEYMGKNSDRTAYSVMKKIIGEEKYKNFVEGIGMKDTSVATGVTSPKDFALLFSKLWSGGLVSEKSRDEILSFLTNTIYEDYIPAGLPIGVRAAHKFGSDSDVVNDAGIIYAKEPYVLILMGDGIIPEDAKDFYPKISKYIYGAEDNVQ